jgi:hypothetical protein
MPMTIIVQNMPTAKMKARRKPRDVFFSPCAVRNPIISGILERWHGLSIILRIPHANEAMSARE